MGFHPFRDSDTFTTFRSIIERVEQEIRGLENSYVLRTSPTELEQHFLDKIHIEPVTFHTQDYYIEEERSVQVDARHDPNRFFFPGDGHYHIPGTQVTIAIPFEGDEWLWKIRASSYSSGGYPEIDLRGNLVLLTHQFADDAANPGKLKDDIDHHVASLKSAVEYLSRDVQQHNSSAPNTIGSSAEFVGSNGGH